VREYAVVMLVAAMATWLSTPVARRVAVLVGAMAHPRDRDVHTIPIPRMGGLAMLVGTLVALLVASRLPVLSLVGKSYDDPMAVAVAGTIICLLGAIDDRWPLDALTKLAGQIVAAGTMTLLGVRLSSLSIPGVHTSISLTPDVSVPLTVLLAVVLINAVNFIDGLDGLAAGVVAIAATANFVFSYSLSAEQGYLRAQPATLLSAVCIGVCVGFLPHNFNPAKVIMGDSGSMLIGLLLAASATSITGEFDFASASSTLSQSYPLLVPLLIPALVLAVPIVDLVLAVLRRTKARRSPFAPDKQHLHHRLLEIGHSHRRAVLLMYAWSAIIGVGGVVVSSSRGPAVPVAVLGGLAIIVLVVSSLPRLRAHRSP